MEDAATAEISRSQVWQWKRHGVTLTDTGEQVTAELVRRLEDEELEKIREFIGDDEWFETRGPPEALARAVRARRAGRRVPAVPHHPRLRRADRLTGADALLRTAAAAGLDICFANPGPPSWTW